MKLELLNAKLNIKRTSHLQINRTRLSSVATAMVVEEFENSNKRNIVADYTLYVGERKRIMKPCLVKYNGVRRQRKRWWDAEV